MINNIVKITIIKTYLPISKLPYAGRGLYSIFLPTAHHSDPCIITGLNTVL